MLHTVTKFSSVMSNIMIWSNDAFWWKTFDINCTDIKPTIGVPLAIRLRRMVQQHFAAQKGKGNDCLHGHLCSVYVHELPPWLFVIQLQWRPHDDVIKWKLFSVTGPLCGEFTGHRWIPLTKASDAKLGCFLSFAQNKQSWDWWFETPSCWLWRHCNDMQTSPPRIRFNKITRSMRIL